MKELKKLLGFWIFILVISLLPVNTFAVDNRDDLIKKIAPDGENAVFKAKKPTSMQEGDFIINGYINSLFQEEDYMIYGICDEETYSICDISIQSYDYESTWDSELQEEVTTSGWRGTYTINVTYDEPKSNSSVNSYFANLNEFSPSDPSTFYIVEDLSLINYYLTSDKSELWNIGAPGRALKYSTLNNVTKGSDVKYYLEIRAGSQDETLMYESAFGPMSIFYNGYSYGTKEEGLYLKRVIYIPSDTADTKEAFVEAAQQRINDYLGDNSVVVSYGGLLSSLADDSEDTEYPITSDGNYYNIQIGNRTYKFYIVKGNAAQLSKPVYAGMNIETNIQITSDAVIPLDTSLSVDTNLNLSIKDKIGTDKYKSYDINLFSEAQNSKIEQLENGKFVVKIPVPTELKGKKLVVYYISENDELEKHDVEVQGNYAIFETNHFSVYTLASSSNNPQTGDNIITNVIMLLLCLSLLTGGLILLKKKVIKHN